MGQRQQPAQTWPQPAARALPAIRQALGLAELKALSFALVERYVGTGTRGLTRMHRAVFEAACCVQLHQAKTVVRRQPKEGKAMQMHPCNIHACMILCRDALAPCNTSHRQPTCCRAGAAGIDSSTPNRSGTRLNCHLRRLLQVCGGGIYSALALSSARRWLRVGADALPNAVYEVPVARMA